MAKWIHWLFHYWEMVRTMGAHDYWQCTVCGERKVTDMNGIAGPVDWQWLSTGKWSDAEQAPWD